MAADDNRESNMKRFHVHFDVNDLPCC